MNITVNEKNGVSIISVSGELTLNTEELFQVRLFSILESSSNKIIIDLNELTFINSAGIDVLETLLKKVSSKNGDLRLVNLHHDIKDILRLLKSNLYKKISSSIDAALKELNE